MTAVPSKHGTAARLIAAGGIIAFRTDTFYGLGADPFNSQALRAIRALKGREDNKPILLLISDASQARRFIASTSELFKKIASRYWPGPLTLVGIARPQLPKELTAGSGTIGVRFPDDTRVRELVRACGSALTATSANPSGLQPSRSAAQVRAYFPTGIDLILDDGEVTAGAPSTVLDLSGSKPRIIREGALPLEELAELLSSSVIERR